MRGREGEGERGARRRERERFGETAYIKPFKKRN